MLNLRATLKLAHTILSADKIDHALIGGLALAQYGSTRATVDLDLLVHEKDKDRLLELFLKSGFLLHHESTEVLQFQGIGLVDIILARRPISKEMLFEARTGGPEGMKFVRPEDLIGLKIQAYKNDNNRELQDKADIQFLLTNEENLDWDRIKKYADLFNEWDAIHGLKNKA